MNQFYCPHCGDRRLALEIDRGLGVDPLVLRCRTCGFRLYGEDAVRDLVARQSAGIVAPSRAASDAAPEGEPEAVRKAAPKRRKPKRRGCHDIPCALCGAPVWRRPWDFRTNASGHFFCCREHMHEHRRQAFAAGEAPAAAAPVARPGGPWPDPSERSRRRRGGTRRSAERRGAQPVTCAMCGERVWRRPWDVRDCKSGLFFCTRQHRAKYDQRAREYTQHMGPAEPRERGRSRESAPAGR